MQANNTETIQAIGLPLTTPDQTLLDLTDQNPPTITQVMMVVLIEAITVKTQTRPKTTLPLMEDILVTTKHINSQPEETLAMIDRTRPRQIMAIMIKTDLVPHTEKAITITHELKIKLLITQNTHHLSKDIIMMEIATMIEIDLAAVNPEQLSQMMQILYNHIAAQEATLDMQSHTGGTGPLVGPFLGVGDRYAHIAAGRTAN